MTCGYKFFIRLLIINRSDGGLIGELKPITQRFVVCVMHNSGVNLYTTLFHLILQFRNITPNVY